MARSHNQKGRSHKGLSFVQLHHYSIKSPAWLSLTPQARAVYIELASRYNGSNNGEIALSVRDAARKCRISKATAGKAFHDLAEKGFITIVTGGSFGYKLRHATEYRLTDYKYRDEPPTKEFMSWQPDNLEPGPKSGQKRP
jgi:hypothetical protein